MLEKEKIDAMFAPSKINSNVSHPSHYNSGNKYEPIDVILDWELNFCLGNVIKYIFRAGKKIDFENQNPKEKEIEDLEKAMFYLNYEINRIKEKE
jgi:hypothetical protein